MLLLVVVAGSSKREQQRSMNLLLLKDTAMPMQFGDFRLPTFGDAIQGGEAMIGNLIEGVVEGVTGEKVELTPGVGVDNTRIDNGKGTKRDIKFDEKMASHVDMERMRRELEKELNGLRSEVTKLKVREAANKKLSRPAVMPNPSGMRNFADGPAQNNAGMNPMMMLMLARDGDMDPLMMMLMMQSMGGNVGSVGGQPMQMDPMAFATMQMFSDAIRKPNRVQALRSQPTPVGPTITP